MTDTPIRPLAFLLIASPAFAGFCDTTIDGWWNTEHAQPLEITSLGGDWYEATSMHCIDYKNEGDITYEYDRGWWFSGMEPVAKTLELESQTVRPLSDLIVEEKVTFRAEPGTRIGRQHIYFVWTPNTFDSPWVTYEAIVPAANVPEPSTRGVLLGVWALVLAYRHWRTRQ